MSWTWGKARAVEGGDLEGREAGFGFGGGGGEDPAFDAAVRAFKVAADLDGVGLAFGRAEEAAVGRVETRMDD